MDRSDLEALAEGMIALGAVLEPGLTDAEVEAAESRNGFSFPPDLRGILQYQLPLDKAEAEAWPKFPDWRRQDDAVTARLGQPIEGILFDVRTNSFWWPAWGEKPSDLDEALAVAREQLGRVPALIPIYGHRYVRASPQEVGNPVFSVMQTDVIYYRVDLRDYL